MSNQEYPLCENLEVAIGMKDNDVQTRLALVKKILEDELESRGLADFSKARFDVARSYDDDEFNIALAKLEAHTQLQKVFKRYTELTPEFVTIPDLLLSHFDNHKYLLGDTFYEILRDVFGEYYDDAIKAMSDGLLFHMKDVMSRYYPGTTAEGHKRNFSVYFQEKYLGTFFEKMVVDFTEDYVINGECLKAS